MANLEYGAKFLFLIIFYKRVAPVGHIATVFNSYLEIMLFIKLLQP